MNFRRKSNLLHVRRLFAMVTALLFAGGALIFAFSTPVQAAQTAQIWFSPSDTRVQPGDELAVDLLVYGVVNLYGAGIEVKFDQKVVQCLKVENGSVFGQQSFVDKKVNSDGGSVSIVATMLGDSRGFTGDGVLAHLTFKASQEGTSNLSITTSDFIDADLKNIAVESTNGLITVGNPGGQQIQPGSDNGSQPAGNQQQQPGGAAGPGSDNSSQPAGNQQQQPGGAAGPGSDNSSQPAGNQQQPGGAASPGGNSGQLAGGSSFTDTKDHWAKNDIDLLTGKGIIKGYEDRTFRPENSITRAEFAVIIARAAGYEKESIKPVPFKDAAKIPGWAAKAVAVAAQKGVFKGDNAGLFRSEDPITRAEIAATLVRVLGREKEVTGSQNGKINFKDVADSWASGYIGVASKAHLINGYEDGTFHPEATATRAETASMIARFLQGK